MKSYASGRQLRLVGKAWEIRHHLRSLLSGGDKELLITDYLTRLTGMPAGSPASKSLPAQSEHAAGTNVLPFPGTYPL